MLHGTDADSFEHVDVNDIDTEAADNKSSSSTGERRAFMARHTTLSSMSTARHNESRDLRQCKGRLMTKSPSSIHFLQMAVDELETGDLEQQDLITSEDWRDMTEFKELLEPFKEATMRTQGRAHDGTYGALWEWLTELELLLTILENKREYLLDQPPSFLRTSVNLAWSKLSTYYELSDETFAYRLAIRTFRR
ncbi:hypothetical protein KCU67_g76, partial [Aureobasidium melanogenum]